MTARVVPKKKSEEIDYKVLSIELASRVLWALKFLRPPSGGDLVFLKKSHTTKLWEEWFMEGLDMIGYKVKRKEFWKERGKKGRR